MSRLRAAPLALSLALSAAALPLPADNAPTSTTQAALEAGDPGDLLDFLADWQGDDGQWVDPMTFERIDPSKVASAKPPHQAKPPAAPPPAGTATPPHNDGKRTAP